MEKINKKDIITILGILGVIVIICSNFLQMHFSSDTFVLYDLGYLKYPTEYFLQDGRLISALFCYAGGYLKLPIPLYIVVMDFLGMAFLAKSIFVVAEIFKNIIKPNSLKKEILIYLSSFILILNQYTLEYLLFPESAVMCLGVLFNVIALKEFVSDNKLKYLKSTGLLFLTGISYQGELNIFPILVILVLIIKQIKEKDPIKEFLKNFIKSLIIVGLIEIAVFGICFAIFKISGHYFGANKQSFFIPTEIQTFRRRFNWIKYYEKDILINCISMFPKYSILICPIVTIILLVMSRAKIQTIINYIFLVIISYASVILPLFVITAGVCSRLSIPAMMIFGSSLIILIANLKEDDKKYKKDIISVVVVLLFIMNSIFIIRNTTEHIIANKLDDKDGKQIKYMIDKYEEETGIEVTKFGCTYDRNPQQFSTGIKPMYSMTERKLACEWSLREAMNYYCERKFVIVNFDHTVFMEKDRMQMNHRNEDYNMFLQEQIRIKDDTLYMIIY